MEYSRNEKSKMTYLTLIGITVFILVACMITFVININSNNGIVPLIFLLLMLYSVLMFLYYFLYKPIRLLKGERSNVKLVYIFFFFINLILFMLSTISIWR